MQTPKSLRAAQTVTVWLLLGGEGIYHLTQPSGTDPGLLGAAAPGAATAGRCCLPHCLTHIPQAGKVVCIWGLFVSPWTPPATCSVSVTY